MHRIVGVLRSYPRCGTLCPISPIKGPKKGTLLLRFRPTQKLPQSLPKPSRSCPHTRESPARVARLVLICLSACNQRAAGKVPCYSRLERNCASGSMGELLSSRTFGTRASLTRAPTSERTDPTFSKRSRPDPEAADVGVPRPYSPHSEAVVLLVLVVKL